MDGVIHNRAAIITGFLQPQQRMVCDWLHNRNFHWPHGYQDAMVQYSLLWEWHQKPAVLLASDVTAYVNIGTIISPVVINGSLFQIILLQKHKQSYHTNSVMYVNVLNIPRFWDNKSHSKTSTESHKHINRHTLLPVLVSETNNLEM